jgi:NAD(P)-dependent dehydrogenase (short-subunit alcohol dehydrogenase family)
VPSNGHVAVITGATSGIGEESALNLARAGWRLVVVARDPQRLAALEGRLRTEASAAPQIRSYLGDLARLAEVRRIAAGIVADEPRVDVLMNNAGAVFAHRQTTSEGLEMTFALNVYSPFLLTQLLLPTLEHSAPARVINVASSAHNGGHPPFDDPEATAHYSGFGRYSDSKLALIWITREYARRNPNQGVTFNALHPGFVATRFGQNNPPGMARPIRYASKIFGINAVRGAQTQTYLSVSPEVATATGEYFAKSRESRPSARALNDADAARFWDYCVKVTAAT